jgi:hypothetical protein
MTGETRIKEALTALADALAKRPAEEILFEWPRSGWLVGELSVILKRRHPDVQARIDEVYREHLAKGSAKSRGDLNRVTECDFELYPCSTLVHYRWCSSGRARGRKRDGQMPLFHPFSIDKVRI